MNVETLEELEQYLREFSSWGNPDAFDFGGAAALLGACLDCLKKQAVDAELEDLEDHLSSDQIDFMNHVVGLMRRRASTG